MDYRSSGLDYSVVTPRLASAIPHYPAADFICGGKLKVVSVVGQRRRCKLLFCQRVPTSARRGFLHLTILRAGCLIGKNLLRVVSTDRFKMKTSTPFHFCPPVENYPPDMNGRLKAFPL